MAGEWLQPSFLIGAILDAMCLRKGEAIDQEDCCKGRLGKNRCVLVHAGPSPCAEEHEAGPGLRQETVCSGLAGVGAHERQRSSSAPGCCRLLPGCEQTPHGTHPTQEYHCETPIHIYVRPCSRSTTLSMCPLHWQTVLMQ